MGALEVLVSLFGPMSAEAVLARCCRIEASPPCKTSAVQLEYLRRRREGEDIRLPPPPEQSGMTPLDWQAQATLILRRAELEVPAKQWAVLRAWHTVPEGPVLAALRDQAVVAAARRLSAALTARGARRIKPKRVRAAVRAWVRLRNTLPREEAEALAKVLGCRSQRHVYRLLRGREGPGEGWWLLLASWREQGVGLAADAFRRQGWID